MACKKNEALFEPVSSSTTNIDFQNNLEPREGFGILYYLYYYNGGGVAIGDVNNDSLPDIYFTANSNANNKLYLNKGNFEFEDITVSAGVAGTADWCTGVTMADVNGDGLLDIYVSCVSNAYGLLGHNELFINNGISQDGKVSFTESSSRYGLDFSGFSTQTAFFDYDHDGDLDCYILNQSNKPNENISDTSNRRVFDPLAGDRLMRNNFYDSTGKTGEIIFTDVSKEAGIYQSSLGYGLGIAVADFNNDGWEDLYIGNDFHENDYYYLNNGNGTFSERGDKHFGHYSRFSMGNDAGDYNNDGHLDIITVDMLPPDEKVLKTYGSDENPEIYRYKIVKNGYQYQYSKNCLQRNNGNGSSFSETALLSGISATDWSWSPLFADFDNDGNKDLFISSGIVKRPVDLDYVRFVSDLAMQKGNNASYEFDDKALAEMPDGSSRPFIYQGDGNGGFTEVSEAWGMNDLKGFYNGAAYGDLDNDGDLDLVMNVLNGKAAIFRNNSPGSNYLAIAFMGESANTRGIGAKAWIFTGNTLQYQQAMPTRGFQSSVESRLHFGLGSITKIDSVLIVWPNQEMQILKNVSAGQVLTVDQQQATGSFKYDEFFPRQQEYVARLSNMQVNWKHEENLFNDFNVQYLIPHCQSTRGPKMAVADINGDGLDDMYLCGAAGQAGALFLQQNDGSFSKTAASLFATDAAAEDTDAIFFDANGDGNQDLYVVTGGNQYFNGDSLLSDRLYFNDGKANFRKATGALPAVFQNKSCVAVADADKDGDPDLFVGTLADAKVYGTPQTSYLLMNDGKGRFSVAGQGTINLTNVGMVTSGVFTDLDKNGWPDLVVAGEWMPLTVYLNNRGTFSKDTIPGSGGLWQSLLATDINGDGNTDLLAGNWGWNNKFHSEKDGAVKLYVADFDNNGQQEQLVSYMKHGTEYPFLAKDEVERQLPLLKKHYLSYTEYAGVPMKDVFYGWIDQVRPAVAERLGSAVCFGDGKGTFNIKDLPAGLQLAPLFSFLQVAAGATPMYFGGGNFYDVTPYEGRYDAQSLALFRIGNSGIQKLTQSHLENLGQVRDIKAVRTKKGNVIAVTRNNDSLLFLKPLMGSGSAN